VSIFFNKVIEHWNNKWNDKQIVLNGAGKNTEQKINTHETQVEKGYLSMVLNQRQLTTPATDW
jgi:hypothetical protein